MLFTYSTIIASVLTLVQSRVCKSLDIRNGPEHMSEFRDCRVIEGNLRIVLMELTEDVTDYYQRGFSELYEITDYLIIFRVMHLTSLDLIFPNLTSIKGRDLFFGYALVLYDLPHLEEIGLNNLRHIENGSVKIDKCPNVCYVDTVNWEAIGVSNLNYTKSNISSPCDDEFCLNECGGHCWNNFRCQNITRSQCDSSCIGCTKPHSSSHCNLCKYFNNSNTCVKKCPPSKVTDNYSNQCLEVKDCTNKNGSWTVFNNTCVPSCDSGSKRNAQGICVFSTTKLCQGLKINSLNDLTHMVGCTHINGSLEIATSGCYFDPQQFEESLGMIISISEYLKIVRSNAVISLDFFKSLRVIQGEKLWSNYYAFFVVQNPNLQRFWNFKDNFTLTIEEGEMIIQDNPYLCSVEIDKLTNRTRFGNKARPKSMIQAHNNGYQTSCNVTSLDIIVEEVTSYSIILSWTVTDEENIVGFTIFYIQVSEIRENATILEVKDGCEGEGWSSVFTYNNTVELFDLFAYSQYAYYIKTYLRSLENEETSLHFFETAADAPSGPRNFEAIPINDTSIVLRWKPPNSLSGELSYYSLAIFTLEDDLPMIEQRNYCIYPHKESCACNPVKLTETVSVFVKDEVCIGEMPFCKRTVYNTVNDASPFRISKRSIESDTTEREISIPGRTTEYLIDNLSQFTMYAFFLKACNNQTDSELCSAAEMVSARTSKNEQADVVTSVVVRVEDKDVVVVWTEPEDPSSLVVAYHVEYKRQEVKDSVLKCVTSEEYQFKGFEYQILGLDPGTYALRVQAVSLAGPGEMTKWEKFEIVPPPSTQIYWVYGFLTLFIVLIVTLLIRCRYKEVHDAVDTDGLISQMHRDEPVAEEEEWKLDEETVEIVRELNRNSLGIVYRR